MKAILYGDDPSRISYELGRLRKKRGGLLERFDTKENSREEILYALQAQSLFDEEKTVLVENADFLNNKNSKNLSIEDLKDIDLPETTDLILKTVKKPNLTFRGMKAFLKDYEQFDCSLMDEKSLRSFYQKECESLGLKLHPSGKEIGWMIDHLGKDPVYILSELEKLAIFSKTPILSEIEQLCVPVPEENIFLLSDAFFEKNADKFIRIYRQFRSQNMEPQAIIGLLASQIRFLFQVRFLQDQRYDQQEIASKLKVSKGRIYFSMKKSARFNSRELLKMLSLLSQLDKQIKNGRIDKDLGLETLVLKQFQNL